MVERVLCKHEVVGSNPSGSTIPLSGLRSIANKFAVAVPALQFDIVNEGFVRDLQSFQGRLEMTLSDFNKAQARVGVVASRFPGCGGFLPAHGFC